MVKSELRLTGTTAFLFAGLPACFVLIALDYGREHLQRRMKQWLGISVNPFILYAQDLEYIPYPLLIFKQ
jgi:hypothetical protein